ncbi:MAG: HepT-like ribonuclease domain-containing protein [bacterium]|jgi:uncharacterized protein with HEPN domain
MLPEDDIIRLRHMLDAAVETMEFIEGYARADLEKNAMLSRAITRDIEIIGEAAGKVSTETREHCPALPWESIVGMRNRLIHGYFNVDLDRVWDTVTVDLPILITELRFILSKIQY